MDVFSFSRPVFHRKEVTWASWLQCKCAGQTDATAAMCHQTIFINHNWTWSWSCHTMSHDAHKLLSSLFEHFSKRLVINLKHIYIEQQHQLSLFTHFTWTTINIFIRLSKYQISSVNDTLVHSAYTVHMPLGWPFGGGGGGCSTGWKYMQFHCSLWITMFRPTDRTTVQSQYSWSQRSVYVTVQK